MVRRILALIFFLACLTVQVQYVYACELRGGAITEECCCPHDSGQANCTSFDRCAWSQASSGQPCCARVIVPTTQFVTEHSGPVLHQKIGTPPPTPSLVVVIDSSHFDLLPSARRHPGTPAGGFLLYYGLPVYLATNRLRI